MKIIVITFTALILSACASTDHTANDHFRNPAASGGESNLEHMAKILTAGHSANCPIQVTARELSFGSGANAITKISALSVKFKGRTMTVAGDPKIVYVFDGSNEESIEEKIYGNILESSSQDMPDQLVIKNSSKMGVKKVQYMHAEYSMGSEPPRYSARAECEFK